MSFKGWFLGALGLMLCASVTARNATQEVNGTSVLDGLVVNAITGQPLKKAFVIAQRTTEGRSPTGRPSPAQVARTSAEGRFVLTLPPGVYGLRVTRNGYLDQSYGPAPPAGTPNTFTLTPGQHVTDLVVRLVPMGVVTGRVYDEDGEPVRNVSVQALRRTFSNARWQLVSAASASTNDLGEYRVIGLSPARYYLCIVYNGYVAAGAKEQYVPLCHPGSNSVSTATPVDVPPGAEASHVDFALKPTHTVGVRGRVFLDSAGEQVAGANVVLMRRETQWSGSQMRAVTDSGGTFDLQGVPPGAYVLRASWFNKSRLCSAREAIEVGSADVQDVKLRLESGSDITGQVRVEGNGQLNLGSLRVSIQPQEPFEPGSPGARVGPTGTFVLRDVPAGSYAISVCCAGGDFYLKAASSGQKDVLEGVTVGAAATPDPLDLLLTPAGGHVEGRVLSDTKPFAGATVVLVPEPDRRNQPHLYFNAQTDQSGRFVMRGIPPGQYGLFAWERIDDGAYRDADTLRRYESLGRVLRVEGGATLTIELPVIPATHGRQ